MGAVPLIAVIGAFRAGDGDGDGRSYVGGRVHVRPVGGTGDVVVRVRDDSVPPAGDADPVAVRLERLTDLRRRGQLTETEYAAARAATLTDAAESAR
jgi:hypothetical protein